MAPGSITQLPAGNPVRVTLPVANEQVGWTMEVNTGAAGVAGCELITAFAEAADVHPNELVTVKLYVPLTKPVTV